MSLYSITSEFARLIDLISEGEIPEEAVNDTLEAVNAEWEERADSVICAIKNFRAECAAIKAEEAALAERRKRKERTIERLEGYLSESFKTLGKESFESARHTVKFRASKAVVIDDMTALIKYAMNNAPEAIRTVSKIEANKDELKRLLEKGEIDGARLEIRSNIQIK